MPKEGRRSRPQAASRKSRDASNQKGIPKFEQHKIIGNTSKRTPPPPSEKNYQQSQLHSQEDAQELQSANQASSKGTGVSPKIDLNLKSEIAPPSSET